MPHKYSITYHETTSPITAPVTKFGGQPVWIGEPQWPLSRSLGTPMQFICQIALPADLFGELPTRMAYLFITDDYENGYVAATYEPDGGENAVILQPNGVWEGPALPLYEGPSLYRRIPVNGAQQRTACEFAVELRSGDDPEAGAWDDIGIEARSAWQAYKRALFEDKIGGTPTPTVNKPEFPDPAQWRLLLQLNAQDNEAGDPFFVNFAYDGVGYAFLSQDGRRGQFFWSR